MNHFFTEIPEVNSRKIRLNLELGVETEKANGNKVIREFYR